MMVCLLVACSTEKKQLPELTYTGEAPRVQDPLSPEDSRQHIQVPDGFEAVLYAAEPNIINPIAFAWDERGRLWVVQSQDYPHGLENDVGGDRITICEDTDKDGKADTFTDFATDQSLSTGIVIVKGGAIVAQAPDMYFLEDTDGDDKMDKRTLLFGGFGTYDTHAGPANLKYGPDNHIWGSVGYSGFEEKFKGEQVSFTRGVFKFSRDGQSFEPIGQFNNNTWGLGITPDFEIFGSTANNNHCCYVGIPLRHYAHLSKLPSWAISSDFIQGHYEITSPNPIPLQQVDVRGGYTAAAGANFYTADNYPEAYRNQMYVNEPTGHVVHIARIVEDGAGYREEDGGNILGSTDSWTAPVYAETGPDGNLWIADWYNPVIQHNPDKRGMENQIWNADKGPGNAHLNPLRDKGHGRIYILTHKDGKPAAIQSLDPAEPKALIAGLQSSNMFWRTTAQRLIVEHQLRDLIPDLIELAGTDGVGAMHALWTLQGLDALENSSAEARQVAVDALFSSSAAVKRAGLALIPETEAGSQLLISSSLLKDDDLHIRLAALLRASELPETDALYQEMESLMSDEVNRNDPWLKAALKIYFREQNYEDIDKEDVVMVIPSDQESETEWRYTEKKPAENWYTTDFKDAKWKTGLAPFAETDRAPKAKTAWTSEDIWIRKMVSLDAAIAEPVLKVGYEGEYEVYVNGKLLHAGEGNARKYKLIRLNAEEVGGLFQAGENVLAVHCHSDRDRKAIDVGIGKVGEFEADRVLTLNTVPSKMAYDKLVLHAMAGEQVEIVLNNLDEMPHNLVVVETGNLEAFGSLVDEFLKNPDAANTEYVPKSRYVLGATQMVDPGEQGRIRLQMPDKPGTYPFVCTFPGHWRIMQGVIEVSARGTYTAIRPNAPKITSMGGGGSHDFLKYFGVADGKIMSQEGANSVTYTEKSSELESLLPKTDVLFLTNNRAMEESTQQMIFDRVNKGMPMLIYHPSTWYNWESWPAYNQQLVGGGSRSHEPLQEFEVQVVKPNHPIMKGVPATFRITDELYRWEKDPAGTEVEVLAIGKGIESGEEFPVVWVVKHRKAKIVGNTLGHDQDAHGLPAYQQILHNSLNWVQGKRR